jgi:DNA-binding MarR family transcriptional regulator
MQTPSDRLADDLMRFFVQVMHGDQDEFLRVIAELDLTIPQMRGMFVISAADGLTLTDLAPRMGLSVAAAGRSIDGLVRGGLVARSEDPHDRRVKRLGVTAAGRAALVRIAGARREGMRRYAETLGEAERAALSDAFALVFARTDDSVLEEIR